MSIEGNVQKVVNLGGIYISENAGVDGDSLAVAVDTSLAARPEGELTTRTNTTQGVITMTAGHGVATGLVDLYWTGGSRENVSATVVVNAVTITGGSGDNLPVATTDIVVSPQTMLDNEFDGDDLTLLAAVSTAACRIAFHDDDTPNGGTTEVYAIELAANQAYVWNDGTSPLAGEVVESITFTHGSTAASTMKLVGAQRALSTPEGVDSSSSSGVE